MTEGVNSGAVGIRGAFRGPLALGVGGWGLGGQCIKEHRGDVKGLFPPGLANAGRAGGLLSPRVFHPFSLSLGINWARPG